MLWVLIRSALVPQQGTFNEYLDHLLSWINKKISILFILKRNALTGAMWVTVNVLKFPTPKFGTKLHMQTVQTQIILLL